MKLAELDTFRAQFTSVFMFKLWRSVVRQLGKVLPVGEWRHVLGLVCC